MKKRIFLIAYEDVEKAQKALSKSKVNFEAGSIFDQLEDCEYEYVLKNRKIEEEFRTAIREIFTIKFQKSFLK